MWLFLVPCKCDNLLLEKNNVKESQYKYYVVSNELFIWIDCILEKNFLKKCSSIQDWSYWLKLYEVAEETHVGRDALACWYEICALLNRS